jgi:hypothetical protein
LKKAVAHLDDAFRYIEATQNRRMRFACILPWYLGMRTLALIKKTPPFETGVRVKVTRREVRATLVFAPLAACSNAVLKKSRDRLAASF